ncbi:molybdenum cofactor guanylyltransferase [Actinospica robiniae]|uniref:molybdenum cofactor guanylyltransferase n=1 Tax=Actinospica robiniae TaxID=304901 RepID=UPI000420E5DD|nr:NTP transferase domain-containing protein [Actinospica robiniae]
MAIDGSDPFDAVVLAGGGARRLDGTDKPALRIGGTSLLDRVLGACADAGRTVCVGPERPTLRPVRWTREDPVGGGPVAALAVGLENVSAGRVLALAADLPFLTAGLVRALVRAAEAADGAVLVDAGGRDQWLAGCYQHAALAAGLDRLRAERGALAGASLRALASPLALRRVADPQGLGFDCDTWEDVRHVRRLVADGGGDQRPPRAESES